MLKGKGNLKLSDGRDLPARFTLGRRTDAKLLFSADISIPGWEFLLPSLEVASLSGTLSDGRAVSVDGFFTTETKPGARDRTRLLGHSSNWAIGDQAFTTQHLVSFEIVNFCFVGTEIEETHTDGILHMTRSRMLVRFGAKDVELRQVPDYKKAEATLRAQRGVQVTCTASTYVNDASEIASVTELIDRLCDVMSVARGTLVSWSSFVIAKPNESAPVYCCFRDSVIRRYSGIELISTNDSEDTQRFLEKGFARCQELETHLAIRKVARAYCETRDGPFLQTRSLAIGVLTEYLAGIRARLKERTHFIDKREFATGWDAFRARAEDALVASFPEIPKRYLPAMLGNFKGVNRRPLDWKLRDLASWLGLRFEQDEVKHFIAIRNSLAHEGDFPADGEPIEHYRRVQHFLDRLILRLFDYHGTYYDFEHRREAKI